MPFYGDSCAFRARPHGSARLLAVNLTARRTHQMDDLKNRGVQDRSRISLTEQHEIRYWTTAFGVSEEQLRAAVNAVGHGADPVRTYLARER